MEIAKRTGGWLYDLTWVTVKGNDFVDFPLVLESEWGLDNMYLDEDFRKLSVARAEHRIMIFQNKTKKRCRRQYRFYE